MGCGFMRFTPPLCVTPVIRQGQAQNPEYQYPKISVFQAWGVNPILLFEFDRERTNFHQNDVRPLSRG